MPILEVLPSRQGELVGQTWSRSGGNYTLTKSYAVTITAAEYSALQDALDARITGLQSSDNSAQIAATQTERDKLT